MVETNKKKGGRLIVNEPTEEEIEQTRKELEESKKRLREALLRVAEDYPQCDSDGNLILPG